MKYAVCARLRGLPLLLSVLSLFLLTAACGGDDDRTPPPGAGVPAVPDPDPAPSRDGDIDGDGVPDGEDNCPSVANRDQRDACTYPAPPAEAGEVVPDGVARINWHRARSGLGPVEGDATLTRGCELHLDYLVQYSAEVGRSVLGHDEDLSRPYATEEGRRAGLDSVLSLGRPTIADAVDGWINTLYHRLPLLHPGLARVGVAYRDSYACVLYRQGTEGGVDAPFPILYPPPDIDVMDLAFTGSESPCPTADDPLMASACPGSATIPSLGLHGLGEIEGVTATYTNLDTAEPVELFRTYWDGGESPHERMGYLDGHVALVPTPGGMLIDGPYEVRVDATVGGEARTYRWRFRTSPLVVDATDCDPVGEHHSPETALEVGARRVSERYCDERDYFRITGSGALVRVELHADSSAAQLDLIAYREDGVEFARTMGVFDVKWLEVEPGMVVEVVGPSGTNAPYLLVVQ